MWMIFTLKVRLLIRYVLSYILYAWRFGHFGFRSVLLAPDLLTNTKAISIGKRVEIRKGARLEAVGSWDGKSPKMTIGDGTSIHLYFHCGTAESVSIGRDVLIASRVYVSDHDHAYDDPEKPARWCGKLHAKPVVIEDGVWIGEGAVILKGVRIGRRAVVGANAVVTEDVPPFTVVGGVPAKAIKHIETGNPNL